MSTVNVNVIMHLTCMDKFMYMQACLARNKTETWDHCGHGHDLTSVAQLSVINIADIRSALDKTLASD